MFGFSAAVAYMHFFFYSQPRLILGFKVRLLFTLHALIDMRSASLLNPRVFATSIFVCKTGVYARSGLVLAGRCLYFVVSSLRGSR